MFLTMLFLLAAAIVLFYVSVSFMVAFLVVLAKLGLVIVLLLVIAELIM